MTSMDFTEAVMCYEKMYYSYGMGNYGFLSSFYDCFVFWDVLYVILIVIQFILKPLVGAF